LVIPGALLRLLVGNCAGGRAFPPLPLLGSQPIPSPKIGTNKIYPLPGVLSLGHKTFLIVPFPHFPAFLVPCEKVVVAFSLFFLDLLSRFGVPLGFFFPVFPPFFLLHFFLESYALHPAPLFPGVREKHWEPSDFFFHYLLARSLRT